MAEHSHAIYAALEAASPSNVGDFLHVLYRQLADFAKQAIDSPAERQAIVEAVGKYFDLYVGPHLPSPMIKPFRESLIGIIDSTLITLAAV